MRKCGAVFLRILLLVALLCPVVAYAEESVPQFPFYAQTNELAVNLRMEMDKDSVSVGKLERGQELTVLSAALNDTGEVWYQVMLASDGTIGYIRSDLLIPSAQIQTEIAQYQATAETTQGEYIGNKKSKKFHRTSCHTLPKETNRVYFSARDEAIEDGFDPCGNCHP